MGKALSLEGQIFGYLSVIGKDSRRSKNGGVVWICKCVCGKEHHVDSESLSGRNTTSCGCKRGRQIDHNRQHKICSRCREDLPLEKFSKNKRICDGHEYLCKECTSKKSRDTKDRNPTWYTDKYKSSPTFRITQSLRNRVRAVIKGNSKSASTFELLGCDVEYLKSHLESQFDENMSWDNYGSYWHIDHIRPCASFDLTQESEQRACLHYTNLQPLEAIENIRKGAKYNA